MTKPELTDGRRVPLISHAHAVRALVLAALMGGSTSAHTAGALAKGDRGPAEGPVRAVSGWRMVGSGQGASLAPSAALPAAQVWTVHKPKGRRASAILTVRCARTGALGLYVSFPFRIWHGDAVVAYRLGGSGPRPVHRDSTGRTERLGGEDAVRALARADRLEVFIDDLGFGVSEAIFRLAGAKAAIARTEEACEQQRAPMIVRVPTEGMAGPPARAQSKPITKQKEEQRLAPAPSAIGPIEAPERQQPPSDGQQPDRPVPETPDPVRDTATPSPSPDVAATPPPPQGETDPSPPSREADIALASPPAVPAPEPPPRPQDPVDHRAADRDARLAAFLQTHGPNRKGEPIYDWYRQCLDHAGVDIGQVWYLSSEELTYLSKGETDRVRLSLRISTSSDLNVPPRRVICHGVSRGRHLTIERAE